MAPTNDIGEVARHPGIVSCVRSTVKRSGAAGLFAGFVPSMLGPFVCKGAQFGLADGIKAFNP